MREIFCAVVLTCCGVFVATCAEGPAPVAPPKLVQVKPGHKGVVKANVGDVVRIQVAEWNDAHEGGEMSYTGKGGQSIAVVGARWNSRCGAVLYVSCDEPGEARLIIDLEDSEGEPVGHLVIRIEVK